MYLFPIESLRQKHGHTPAADGSTKASPRAEHPGHGADRGSIITVTVILLLVLGAIGSIYSARIKKRKAEDVEQQLPRQANTAHTRRSSSTRRQSRYSMDKLLFVVPRRERADSRTSTLLEYGEEVEKRQRSWPNLTSQSIPISRDEHYKPRTGAIRAPGDHLRSTNRTEPLSLLPPSPSQREGYSDSTRPRRASYHRRQSSIHSVDTYVPTHRDSLSPSQSESGWCDEVPTHGGGIAPVNRRLPILAPILEPEAALQDGLPDEEHSCGCGRPDPVR